jgi:hypothetical protein
MASVTVSKSFNAPPDRVFEVITDLRSAPQRITTIKKLEILTDGPIGMGTRFKETRIMFGREASETMEITRWDPPRSYTVEANACGSHYLTTFTVRPDGRGSTVELTFDATPTSFVSKLVMVPLGWMMKGMCRKMVEKDLDDLKRFMENEPAGVQAAV